jgi:hypothetical protein
MAVYKEMNNKIRSNFNAIELLKSDLLNLQKLATQVIKDKQVHIFNYESSWTPLEYIGEVGGIFYYTSNFNFKLPLNPELLPFVKIITAFQVPATATSNIQKTAPFVFNKESKNIILSISPAVTDTINLNNRVFYKVFIKIYRP